MEKKIKLFKKQQLAFQYLRDKFTNIVVYAGSAGSAKSFLGCVWLISNCIEYPGTNWAMCRNYHTTLYDEFYIKYKNDCLPEYVKFITTTTNDNPSLPESYVEGLKRLPSPKFERLYLGLWEYSESDIFFDRLSLNDIFNKNLIYNKNKYISCDVAGEGRDMSIILIWQDYKVIDYYKEDKTNLMDLVTKIKSYMTKYNIKASNVVVDNQGIGAVVGQNIIGCHRFAANNKAIDEAYSDIRSECIFKMRELFSMIDISILSQYSERIIREFSAHKIENSDKNKIISKKHTKQKLGFSPDWFDALYMRFVFEIKQKYYTRY
jgi:phage terminase large subunit